MSNRRSLVLVAVLLLAALGAAVMGLRALSAEQPMLLSPASVMSSDPGHLGATLSAPAAVQPGTHHQRVPHDRVPDGTPRQHFGQVLLGQLVVAPHEQGPSFDRVRDFGTAWTDTNGNGCDTRSDVIAAWFADTTSKGCKVLTGTLTDPYTGAVLTSPSQADIDHVVSLGDAWRSGAARWTRADRVKFANDFRHLVPTTASVNRAKGDKPIEKWTPPDAAYRCDYALIIIGTKKSYGLTVTTAERAALAAALATC